MNGNILALFAAVAVLLTVTVAMTLSPAAPVASSLGTLKCYELTKLIEKPCDQPPRIIQTSNRSARSD
jgi:hypothetical protein